jgi:prevent-host-death family protein
MSKTISVEEADKAFECIIGEVLAGEEYVLTRNGRPVARLVPVEIGFGPLDLEGLRRRGWLGSIE